MPTTWHPVSRGPVTGVDWPRWLSGNARVDPYLVWADLTRLAGYSASADGARLPVLIEFAESAEKQLPNSQPRLNCTDGATCHPIYGMLDISSAYKAVAVSNDPSKHTTMRKHRFVTALVLPQCVEELYKCPEMVVRFQLGLARVPRVDPDAVSRATETRDGLWRTVIGVIDDGFAFANANFCDASGTPRTCFLWDQDGDGRPWPWRLMSDYRGGLPGYGAELHHEDIQSLVAAQRGNHNQSAAATLGAYARADYAPRRPSAFDRTIRARRAGAFGTDAPVDTMIHSSHGTSVAALAAGSWPALAPVSDAQGQWPSFTADISPSTTWPIVFVQLPTRTSLDTSGGSLGVHVLDGLHYIIQRAQSMEPKASAGLFVPPDPEPRRPAPGTSTAPETVKTFTENRIIVNISYGAIGGPHDGTSIIEQAIAELVSVTSVTSNLLWVNVAAGNARGSDTSCRLTLGEGGPPGHLSWTVGPDNRTESYLEIWLPDGDLEGNPLHESWLGALHVEVQPPAGLPALRLRCGNGRFLAEGPDGQPLAAAVFARRVAQGLRGTLLLLACARTSQDLAESAQARPGRRPPAKAPAGTWDIRLKWHHSKVTGRKAIVHAWAERNDQLWGFGRRQQSTVSVDDPIPGKTEFSPSVQEFCRRGAMAGYTDDVPKPFQAELSSSSLANIPHAEFLRPQPQNPAGRATQAGGWRLSDQEMAPYSGTGVTRLAPADRGRLPGGHCGPGVNFTATRLDKAYKDSTRNTGPVVDAPSDAGLAVRGLRTIGLRDGSVARLGGTSAAAPLVSRHLAFTLDGNEHKSDLVLLPTPAKATENAEGLRRPTLTPTRDDRFHKGVHRIGPKRR